MVIGQSSRKAILQTKLMCSFIERYLSRQKPRFLAEYEKDTVVLQMDKGEGMFLSLAEKHCFCLLFFQLEFVVSHPVFDVRNACLKAGLGVFLLFWTAWFAQLTVISIELVRTGVVGDNL